MDGSGSFVVTWTDLNTTSGDIWAQRYNASGTAREQLSCQYLYDKRRSTQYRYELVG